MYEDLVRALRAADARPCSDLECPGSGECPTVGCLFREAADAIEELEASVDGYEANTDVQFVERDGYSELRLVPKWIPVTERLPENGKSCLCYNEGGAYGQLSWIDIQTFIDEYGMSGFRHNRRYGDLVGAVTHWMPLPEPPKEETE